jgi:hypothetical protein
MNRITVFHEDVFYEYFQPFRHPTAKFDIWGGHGIETHGSDLHLAASYDANYVWTVVDGDAGIDQWIVPGFHRVNRVCYLFTIRPHFDAPIEFRVEHGPRSLTSIGLKRRVTVLKRILAAHNGENPFN